MNPEHVHVRVYVFSKITCTGSGSYYYVQCKSGCLNQIVFLQPIIEGCVAHLGSVELGNATVP